MNNKSDWNIIDGLLNKAVYDIPIEKVIIGQRIPDITSEILDINVQSQPWHRIIIPISGVKHITLANKHKMLSLSIKPGQLLYFPPLCWSIPHWNSLHEMIAIVFREKVVRIVYINFDSLTKKSPLQTNVFHIPGGGSANTNSALYLLNNLIQKSIEPEYTIKLTECLLRFALEDLSRCEGLRHGKSYLKWLALSEYVQGNFQSQLTRDELSEMFTLTPEYVSKLFKLYSGKSFSEVLTNYRMHHARELLLKTDLVLKQISRECGYKYVSYFIKIFHNYYGMSPGNYRCSSQSE